MANVYNDLERAVSVAFEGPEVKKGYLGYVVNGAFTVVVARDTTLYYVRYDDGSVEEVPHKGRVSPQRNAPVKVGVDDTGERSILGINREEATVFAGAAGAGSMAIGPHSHERGSSMQYLIDPYLITPLRVKHVSETTVEIGAGHYKDSSGDLHWRLSEQVDISSYITGTSYHHSWIVVWINQDTGASGVTSGTSQTIALPLYKSGISSVSLPSGSIPLVAIPVKNGQSTLYEVDFEDMRYIVGIGNYDFASKSLSNLSSVAINTSLISDTDSTDDLGSSSAYWRNGYIDTLYVSEQSSPSTPAAGKVVIYAKSDGLIYIKDDAGVETQLGGGLPSFGSSASKTISSDVVSSGSDRHLVISAQTGTADDLIEITGLSVGNEVVIRAASGHTITVKHNSGSATDKIILHNATDIALSGDKTLKLFKAASGKVVQYVDDSSGGPVISDAFDVPYTATNPADWSTPPTNSGEALDTIAADLTDLAAGGVVRSVVAGTNIAVDNTDPEHPILSSTSTPGGGAPPSICEGRLTLTTGTPVTTTDVTGATTLYFAPHKGSYIGLYNGSSWELKSFTELSISLAGLLPHSIHDVYAYDNSGTPTLEIAAWNAGPSGAITGATNATPIVITTSGTAPATGAIVTISGVAGNTAANGTFRVTNLSPTTYSLQALAGNANVAGNGAYTSGGNWYQSNYTPTRATSTTFVNGIELKSGATTRRLLGTIRITSTAGQCEDSEARRFLSNLYNPVLRSLRVNEGTDSWSYGTAATRPLNNSLLNRVEVVLCEARHITVDAIHNANRVSGNGASTGIDVDGIVNMDEAISGWLALGNTSMHAKYRGYLAAGYHYFQQLESANGASNTFYGDFGQSYPRTGMSGDLLA